MHTDIFLGLLRSEVKLLAAGPKYFINLSFTTPQRPQQPLTTQHLTTNTDYSLINASTISTSTPQHRTTYTKEYRLQYKETNVLTVLKLF
jgi:hypothetical protein